MTPGISVVICCYNSAKRLPDTLRHLQVQKIPNPVNWEVIVVNNNSKDETREVAEHFIKTYLHPASISAKVVDEPVPGLTAARERGIAESKFSYVLFCDDDNWLEENFIFRLQQYLDKHKNSKIGVIGSYGVPVGEVTLPSWLTHFQSWYATGQQSETDGDVTVGRPVVFGAASLLNKEAYHAIRKAGFKSFLTDRLGSSLSAGGDFEICMALALAGYKTFYFSDLQFRHFLNAQRLQKSYIKRLSKEGAISTAKLLPYSLVWKNIDRKPRHFSILYLSSIHIFRIPRILKQLAVALLKGNRDEQFEKKISLFDEFNLLRAKIKVRRDIREQYYLLRQARWIRTNEQALLND